MKIIRKCGGLPLAIKVMGGLLPTRHQSESEWEAVLNHHAWSVDGLHGELDNRIYLSYDDLSPYLKQCFIYCSLFPNGTHIVRGTIILMWISEGFIQPRNSRGSQDDGLEEVAIEYYQELIMRNLIEPINYSNIYKCTMHDVVRSFAEFMAREESLVLHKDETVSSGCDHNHVRRLSIGSTKSVAECFLLKKKEALRTLIINGKIRFKASESLISFPRLRVLYIEHADCNRLIVDSLCQLRHLRYLRLSETNVSKLPYEIYKMKLLHHIVLRNCRSLENLFSSIVNWCT